MSRTKIIRNRVMAARELYYMGKPVDKIDVLGCNSRLIVAALDKNYDFPVGTLYTGLSKNYLIFREDREQNSRMLAAVEIPSKAIIIVRFKNGVSLEVREK